MMKPGISLFAEHEREDRRTKLGDPLIDLVKLVDFEARAESVDLAAAPPPRTKGGRPPYPTPLMIKILVLQQIYNLADDVMKYQLLGRRGFLQFLDLTDSSSIPDAKTIWLSRDRLAQAGVGSQIFEQVQQQLSRQGYMARRNLARPRFNGASAGWGQRRPLGDCASPNTGTSAAQPAAHSNRQFAPPFASSPHKKVVIRGGL